MEKLNDIITAVTKDYATICSIAHWEVADKTLLERYKTENYYTGIAYKNDFVTIYKFMEDDSDFDIWVCVGLTEDEMIYIANGVDNYRKNYGKKGGEGICHT